MRNGWEQDVGVRYRQDMGKMWARCGQDVGKIWARCEWE